MCAKSSQVARKSVGSSVSKAAKEAVSKKKKKSKKSKKRNLDLIIDEEVPPVKVPKIDADDFDLVDSYQETVENGETVQTFDSFLQFSKSHRKKLRKKVNEGKFTVEGEYYVFDKSPGHPKSKVKAELFNGMGPSWKDMPKPAWKIAQEQKEVDSKPGKNDKIKLRDVEAYEDPKPKEFKLFSNEEILLYTDPPLDFFKLFENGDFYENGKVLVFPPEEDGSLKRGISAKNYRKHSTLLAECPDIPPEMFFYERTVPFTPEKCSSLPKNYDPEKLQKTIELVVKSTTAGIKTVMARPEDHPKGKDGLESLTNTLLKVNKKLDLMQKRLDNGSLHFLGHEPWRIVDKSTKIMAIRAALQS